MATEQDAVTEVTRRIGTKEDLRSQISDALEILPSPHRGMSLRKWSGLIDDKKFGPELSYLIRRIFLHEPFAQYCERSGWVIEPRGRYGDLIDFLRSPSQVTISHANDSHRASVPFLIRYEDWPQFPRDDSSRGMLMREFWRLDQQNGVSYLPLQVACAKNDFVGETMYSSFSAEEWAEWIRGKSGFFLARVTCYLTVATKFEDTFGAYLSQFHIEIIKPPLCA